MPEEERSYSCPARDTRAAETEAKRGRDSEGGGAGSRPPRCDSPRTRGAGHTCCFMVFVSHSSSFPGTWLVPLLPMSSAEKSTWDAGLGAAAEQTKEAPLGLHARDRILQHTWGGVSTPHPRRKDETGRGSAEDRACRAQRGGRPPAHLGMSSLMLISQRFFLASVS